MNPILLVDLGERELKERRKLRDQQRVLQTIDQTKETSGGLSAQQVEKLRRIEMRLSSDVVVDDFYRVVAASIAQTSWESLEEENHFVHEYGLLGSQRIQGQPFGKLEAAEREIAGVCGLLQLDGQTEPGIELAREGRPRPGFVQKISIAQGEYRENRALFDAAFEQLMSRYPVPLHSQVKAGLIDPNIVGCIYPGGDPETESRAKRVSLARTTRCVCSVGATWPRWFANWPPTVSAPTIPG